MSYYVGLKPSRKRETFSYKGYVTEKTHGHKYNAVIGPFRTKFSADLMAFFGPGNIHMQSVYQSDEWAKRLRAKGVKTLSQYLAASRREAIVERR